MDFVSRIEPRLIYSNLFQDIYWSKEGGLEEKKYVFIEGNFLKERWKQKPNFTIFELGFGAGLNFFATKTEWENSSHTGILHYISTELYPIPKATLYEILSEFEELKTQTEEFFLQYPSNFQKVHRFEFPSSRVILTLWIGKALDALRELYFYADAYFLDGFSPSRNPEMWSKEIFIELNSHTKDFSTFATYSVSKLVRESAIQAGFEIQTKKGFGKKKQMLLGSLHKKDTKSFTKKYFPIPNSVNQTKEITIVGAGISGLSLAYSFLLRGKKVTIIDENSTLGENASSNPVGYFFPKLTKKPTIASELSLLGTAFTTNRIQTWNQIFQERIGESTGVFLHFANKEKRKEFETAFESHYLNPNLLVEKEVEVFENSLSCIHFQLGGYFLPFQFSKKMIEFLQKNGVSFLFGKKIQKLKLDETWKLYDENENLIFNSETVILANSFGIQNFTQTQSLPFQKIRGQICYLPSLLSFQVPILFEETYLISIKDKTILGATFNPYDSNPNFQAEQNELLVSRLRKSLNNFPNYDIKNFSGKVGFRSNSKDRLPVLGMIPIEEEYKKDYKNFQKGYKEDRYPTGKVYPNLYILSGMGSKGISYAPILAESLVSLLYMEVPPLPIQILEALHPARFIIREIMNKKI